MSIAPVSPTILAPVTAPTTGSVPAPSEAATPPAPTASASATVEMQFSLSVELGVRISIGRERAAAIPPSGVEERYDEIEEDDDVRSLDGELRERARRIARRLDRLVHRELKPLLRGRTGVDAETRAELRDLRRSLREDLRTAMAEAGDADDFDVVAFASAISAATDRFAEGFATVFGPQEDPSNDVDAGGEEGVVLATPHDAPLAVEIGDRFGPRDHHDRPHGHRRGRPFVDRDVRIDRARERVEGLLGFVQDQLRGLMAALEPDEEDPTTPEIPVRDGTRDLQPVFIGTDALRLLA